MRFIRSLISELKRESNLTSNEIEDANDREGAISDSLHSSRALFGSVDCTKIEEQLFEALEYGPGMLSNTSRISSIPIYLILLCLIYNYAARS